MTRKELVDILNKVFGKGLHAAMIVFRSPLDDKLQERHIYADEYFEANLWAKNMEDQYRRLGVDFGVWVNNHLVADSGTVLIKEEDCVDE